MVGLRDYLGEKSIESKTVETISDHGRDRWKQSFDLRDFVRDWGHLHASLIIEFRIFFEAEDTGNRAKFEALDRLAAFITESMSTSITEYERLQKFEAAALYQDLKRLRERDQLRVQQRSRALREYAHDMRGSLMAIAGAGAMMTSELSGEQLVRMADALDEGVEAIAAMLERLLELSGLEAGLETPDFKRVEMQWITADLERLLRPMAEEKSLELKIKGEPRMIVETDSMMLRRILQNLLVNAIKYTRRGVVKLEWHVPMAEAGRWVCTVEDTGPGIQNSSGSFVAQQINHSYVGREVEDAVDTGDDSNAWTGEGIGLSVVKRLCELLDIQISLESESGKGTCFTLKIPRDYAYRKNADKAT